MTTLLVAGVGNVWLGDDAFGSEVARRLAGRLPAGVEVRDFGIRALDLQYALERYEAAIVVDVVRRGGAPGTLYVLEPIAGATVEPHHGVAATEVIQWAADQCRRGANPRTLWLVGCEPESFGEPDEGRLGMSAPVERAVEDALALIEDLAFQIAGGAPCTSSA